MRWGAGYLSIIGIVFANLVSPCVWVFSFICLGCVVAKGDPFFVKKWGVLTPGHMYIYVYIYIHTDADRWRELLTCPLFIFFQVETPLFTWHT